jgi:hypothetical protein
MIYGLDPSNSAGDLTADIAIAAGIAIDSTNTPTLVLPKSLIKRIEVRGAYRAPLRYWPVPQASGYLSGAVCTRRLSSTTFAPTCNVMFAPGYRSQAAR